MSTETVGEKLRKLREQNKLPLRKVAVLLDLDVAILSKMERGERKFSKNIILKLASIYNYNANELILLFLSDKLLYEIENEELGLRALKITEKRVKYLKESKSK